MTNLKYLHALNILVSAEIGALEKISNHFQGNLEQAWHSSNLRKFLSSDAPLSKSLDPDKEYDQLQKEGVEIIALTHSAYPDPLKNISDPPFLLYCQGDIKILKNNCLAIVGTRNLTEYGQRVTSFLAEKLSLAGLTIVSGLARGIDGLAHRAAVKNKKPTIAVLGGGFQAEAIVAENRSLAKEIIKTGGAIITEYPPQMHAHKMSFPQRNRLISGLSKGVLIVEADEKSGSLITARHALDQNRDVFAVPGSIFSSKSQGPNRLIKMGAKTVTTAEDILTEYQIESSVPKLALAPSTDLEKEIIEIIGSTAVGMDTIIRQTKKSSAEVISCLMDMELENKITNLGNNRFSLSS